MEPVGGNVEPCVFPPARLGVKPLKRNESWCETGVWWLVAAAAGLLGYGPEATAISDEMAQLGFEPQVRSAQPLCTHRSARDHKRWYDQDGSVCHRDASVEVWSSQ